MRRSLAAAAAPLVLVLALQLAAASPATAQPVGLSITLTDGTDQTAPGATVAYSLALTNTGTGAVDGTIVATVPAYATVVKADGAVIDGTDATWRVTVEPGASMTEALTVSIGAPPDGEQFVTVLAAFYVGGDRSASPTVRTADPDRLPGVAAPGASTASSGASSSSAPAPSSSGGSSGSAAGIIAVALGVLVVGVGVVFALARARRRQRGSRPRT